jgi:type IV pilus assembly protein PilA
MLIKMRESKGFTLVELMIVVAIIGILSAVAVPYYQTYMNKARFTSLVVPGTRTYQNNLATFYAARNYFPATAATLANLLTDASSDCYNTTTTITAGTSPTKAFTFTITIAAPTLANMKAGVGANDAARCEGLKRLVDSTNAALMGSYSPVVSGTGIKAWVFTGSLADKLGLAYEGS